MGVGTRSENKVHDPPHSCSESPSDVLGDVCSLVSALSPLREGRSHAKGMRPEGEGVFGEHKPEGSQKQRIHT